MRWGWLGVLLLCACGEPTSRVAPDESSAKTGSAVATTRTADLPDYLPDYPNSTRIEVPNLGAPGTDSRSDNTVAMETDATPALVAQYYRDQFAAAGVPIRTDTANANGGLIAVGRDGERGAVLTISSIGGKTRIAVIQGPRG